MPLNPDLPPTKVDKLQEVYTSANGWLYDHAAVIAAFLAGILTGLVVG